MHVAAALIAVLTLVFGPAASAADDAGLREARAVFAGGCFWCMEPPYDKLDGVLATTSGYAGGDVADPTYKEVVAGGTGHFEVVEVRYDPTRVSYQELLDVFWVNVDPFDDRGQFCDKGASYKTAIFAGDESEQALAEASLEALQPRFGERIVTEILPAARFYAAEDYHQDYYQKNPVRYRYYRYSCGRDQRLAEIWGGG